MPVLEGVKIFRSAGRAKVAAMKQAAIAEDALGNEPTPSEVANQLSPKSLGTGGHASQPQIRNKVCQSHY